MTYVLYPDEGHGFARPENRIDFNARAEAFLAACLGGRVEPLPADGKVPGSTGRREGGPAEGEVAKRRRKPRPRFAPRRGAWP